MRNVLFATVLCVMMSTTAWAEKIYLVHSAAPGGSKQAQIQALRDQMESAGRSVEVVNTNSCRTAENWLRSNPNKPAITVHSLEDVAYNRINPGTDQSCDIPFSPQSLIAVATTAYMNVCSMHDHTTALAKLRQGGNRIGVTFFPFGINEYLAQGLVRNLSIPDTRIVKYRNGAEVLQALVSRDIDFVMMSSAHLVTKSGGTCFLSTAPKKHILDPKVTSIETLDPNNAWIGKSHTFTYVGFNIDMSDVRKIVVDTVNTHPTFKSQFKQNAFKVGVASGDSESEQWQWVDSMLRGYGNLRLD
jgi:hypothetical protein